MQKALARQRQIVARPEKRGVSKDDLRRQVPLVHEPLRAVEVLQDCFEEPGPLHEPLGQAIGLGLAVPIMTGLWDRGTRYFLRVDPALAGQRFGYEDFVRAARARRVPMIELVAAIPRFLYPAYHPRNEASSEVARAFLDRYQAAAR